MNKFIVKKLIEKSRIFHNHKPQPTPDTKKKRKMTKTNTYKTNKQMQRSTQTSSLFSKRGDHNAKRNERMSDWCLVKDKLSYSKQ